jgi:hypothetical protein
MMGDSGFEKRLRDSVRRLDEKSGFVQDLLSEKINHLRTEVQGNDKRYQQRFDAQEAANDYAQEKSNEFRGALNDVSKNQMPRSEADREFSAIRDQQATEAKANRERVEELRARMDRNEGLGSGEKSGKLSQQQLIQWILYLVLAAIAIAAYVRKG